MKKHARSALLFVMPALGAVGIGLGFPVVASADPHNFPPPPPVNENAPEHVQTACQAIIANNPNVTPPGFHNSFAEDIFEQIGLTMGCFGP